MHLNLGWRNKDHLLLFENGKSSLGVFSCYINFESSKISYFNSYTIFDIPLLDQMILQCILRYLGGCDLLCVAIRVHHKIKIY